MNFKIINTPDGYPDVLVRRYFSEEGSDIVIITAYGTVNGDQDQIVEEAVFFEEPADAQEFIENYTDTMAKRFCIRQEVTY